MKIILKRIMYEKYDEIVDDYSNVLLSNYENVKNKINDSIEEVIVDGRKIELDIDLSKYNDVISKINSAGFKNPAARIDIEFSKLLFEDFKKVNLNIPDYILYEKEVWTYLNIFVFYEIILERFTDLKNTKKDKLIKKIERLFFCKDSKIDRTGFRWLWVLGNITIDSEFGHTLLETAKEYIDPVKAIYECCLGKNPIVFKAFIRAIQITDNNGIIKNSEFKSIVPKHIRNSALMNVYESFNDINELAKVISNDIRKIINITLATNTH